MKKEIITTLIGKIVVAELDSGKTFCSKLVQIDGNELWFVNRNGIYIMNRRDRIKRIAAINAKKKPADDYGVTGVV